ncbi:methylated-DNA--[protein]-cysteine S-methyltransferase [Acidihalobacter ferrooxydans]|uniref:Methylated-DNA--protein-cysteine methyltransferase n=1 Tax=Acidihalobacter ferrooxydans TaxID=1765967 RepID=A0A1P8UEB7_9GAMM|nr:methylated-DNA--[protein]-cysteine S-methyltransferase [Acidihalobacter ferrooxydans]APZ42160.1 hypothetical protein BW247_02835 [Acidihalobacter ferrooxydans]
MTAPVLYEECLVSPIGDMTLLTDAAACVHAVEFNDHPAQSQRALARRYGAVQRRPATTPSAAFQALTAYFAGDLTALDAPLPLAAQGTAFQQSVWQALRHIPLGHTLSYGELAAHIGRPRAVRAVGLANGANPISIIVPCHRVIGADRTLTGYSGGIGRKRWLLRHEGLPVEGDHVGKTAHRVRGAAHRLA